MSHLIYLSYEQILIIHEGQIEKYGGSHGVRDEHLLRSALDRPASSFMDTDLYPEVYDKATALVHSILLNHPFIDGNKRTGMVSMIVFLELNGYALEVSQEELVETAVAIATKKMGIEEITFWIKEHSVKNN